QADDQAGLHGIAAYREYDWNGGGRRLGRKCRRNRAREEHGHSTAHQISCHRWQSIVSAFLVPTVFDGDVASLDETGIIQALSKRLREFRIYAGWKAAEVPDHWHRLLRTRRERPRGRTCKSRDELAAVHSSTSSACCRNGSGMVRPSAFAVLRLTISSNLVGSWTGRSPGLAPLRIRSTYDAARR